MERQTMNYKYDLLKDGLTQSQIMNYIKCKRYFYLSLIRGWSPDKLSSSIVLGILFHECLDRWYSGVKIRPLDLAEDVLEDYEIANKNMSLEERQAIPEIHARLTAILPAYFDYWEKEDNAYKWIGLESIFKVNLPVTLRNGRTVKVPITGKNDGLLEHKKKRLVFETKTKGRINYGGITNTLLYDFQVNLYLWASEQVYKSSPVKGFIYNIIHTSNLRLNTKEDYKDLHTRIAKAISKNPGEYFTRIERVVSDKHKKQFGAFLKEIVTEIANFVLLDKAKAENRFTSPCLSPYGQCELLSVCYDGDSSGLTRRTKAHPEL
jgi:hypothetical protein